MSNMSKWIQVDPDKINTAHKGEVNGVTVNLYLPPAVIPKEVKGELNVSTKKFEISFRYLSSFEEGKLSTFSQDGVVEVLSGVLSKRIHQILVDIHKSQATHVNLQVINAVAISIRNNNFKSLDTSFNAALAALESVDKEVFASCG